MTLTGSDGIQNAGGVNKGKAVACLEKDNVVLHPNGIYLRIGSLTFKRDDQAVPAFATAMTYCQDTEMLEDRIEQPAVS